MKKIPADGVSRKHAQFDAEYKREALQLWRARGIERGEIERGQALGLGVAKEG